MALEHVSSGSFWRSPKRWFGTTDAMELGKLYLVLSFINAMIAGTYALLIRLELWTPLPGPIFTDPVNGANDYNAAFTLHGTGMIFLVIVPLGAGFANYLIPRMVAADNNDMYWPKWNSMAFWLLPFGSLLIWLSSAPIGWTAYVPLSLNTVFIHGVDMWILGLVLVGTSSTIGGLNFIMTIWKGRAPYVKWMEMDLFVWGTLFTSLLVIFATPVLTVALVLVLFDRNFGTSFFAYTKSIGNPIMYQHIFWFYSHPAVYIMVLPAFGLISGLISKFSRRPIFGYSGMVLAMGAITALSFSVWAHHMYVTGINPFIRIAFTTMTFAIAVPSGIKVFNWITTLYSGRVKLDVPMLFAISFVIMFTFGGITGMYVNIVPLDLYLTDTYWVVGHFHFIVAAGTLQAMFGAIYYYFPDFTGKMYHKLTAKIHFWLWTIGTFVTFTTFEFLGAEGMPRRYFTYPLKYETLHRIATVGAFTMGLGFAFFLASVFLGYFRGEIVKDMDNIFDLGTGGYNFPKPFAEYVKETTGEEIHVDHKPSYRTAIMGLSFIFPMLAVIAFRRNGALNVANGNGRPLEFTGPVIGVIFLVIFAAIFVWFLWTEANAHLGEKPTLVDKYRNEKERNWEIWIFLASETIFFGALIGVNLAFRMNNESQYAAGQSYLGIPLTAFNTFVLICSSFTMAKAIESIKEGDQKRLERFLLYTILLGCLFIALQGYEYTHLIQEGVVTLVTKSTPLGLVPASPYPLFSSSFFIQTGFHGAHVTVGIIFLIFILVRAHKGAYTKENYRYVEYIGLYWHFVDLVWIILFTVIYLI